ncbi:hypothetical protein PJU52_003456 [Klebsiella michiganensis]|nr:hypothetical protein [Klebsiella michiganensis]
MLLKLTNFQNNIEGNEQLEIALTNLFNSYLEKKHVILASKELFQDVLSSDVFSRRIRNLAKYLLTNYREMRAIPGKLSTYIEVDLSLQQVDLNKQEGSPRRLGYGFFIDSESVQRANFLCEDLMDCNFYKFIGDFYKREVDADGLLINLEFRNGGGSGTKRNYDELIRNNKMCLCILDSDKKHPYGAKGDTCLAFNGVTDKNFSHHFVLEVHEAESLIPMGLINLALESGKINRAHVTVYDSFLRVFDVDATAKKYLDHKKGLEVNAAAEIDEKLRVEYWTNIVTRVNGIPKNRCVTRFECECREPCKVVEGFGDRLLSHIIEELNETSPHKLRNLIKDDLYDDWFNIGKEIFSWGCAPNKQARTS